MPLSPEKRTEQNRLRRETAKAKKSSMESLANAAPPNALEGFSGRQSLIEVLIPIPDPMQNQKI